MTEKPLKDQAVAVRFDERGAAELDKLEEHFQCGRGSVVRMATRSLYELTFNGTGNGSTEEKS